MLLAIVCTLVALMAGLRGIYLIMRDAAGENKEPDTATIADSIIAETETDQSGEMNDPADSGYNFGLEEIETGKEEFYEFQAYFRGEAERPEIDKYDYEPASSFFGVVFNTETGEAISIGEIGQGTQLAGLFMVPQPMPEPEVIDEIYVEGFTAPVWGEHPDFDLEVAEGSHYSINEVRWYWINPYIYEFMEEDDIFDHVDATYYLSITFEPEEGYMFSEGVNVFYNGDPSIFDATESYFINDGAFVAFTILYNLTDPTTDVVEQTAEGIALWPNPATNILYLNVMDGTSVSVFDMTGRLVRQQRYEGQIDLSSLVPGIYALKAEGSKIRFVKE